MPQEGLRSAVGTADQNVSAPSSILATTKTVSTVISKQAPRALRHSHTKPLAPITCQHTVTLTFTHHILVSPQHQQPRLPEAGYFRKTRAVEHRRHGRQEYAIPTRLEDISCTQMWKTQFHKTRMMKSLSCHRHIPNEGAVVLRHLRMKTRRRMGPRVLLCIRHIVHRILIMTGDYNISSQIIYPGFCYR